VRLVRCKEGEWEQGGIYQERNEPGAGVREEHYAAYTRPNWGLTSIVGVEA